MSDDDTQWSPEPGDNPDEQGTVFLEHNPENYGVDSPPDGRITGYDHPVDKRHRFPNVPYQVSPVRRIVVGNPDSFPLTFRARSVMASNYTTQFAYVDAADDWIPPLTVGWIRKISQDTPEGRVYWGAPAGINQPAIGSASSIMVVLWFEAELDPHPGVSIASQAGTPTIVSQNVPSAANVLDGSATANGGTIITVPAGRTWIGTAGVSIDAANPPVTANGRRTIGIQTAGTGVSPAAGTTYVGASVNLPDTIAGAVMGESQTADAFSQMVIVAPITNAVTMILVTATAGVITTSQLLGWAVGVLQ